MAKMWVGSSACFKQHCWTGSQSSGWAWWSQIAGGTTVELRNPLPRWGGNKVCPGCKGKPALENIDSQGKQRQVCSGGGP